MSKTDKTRPWWVRATESPMVTCVPVHRHHLGECDLPDDPADALGGDAWWWAGTPLIGGHACYWAWTPAFYYGRDGGSGCQCWMCGDTVGRRRRARRERRKARQETRAVLRDLWSATDGGG